MTQALLALLFFLIGASPGIFLYVYGATARGWGWGWLYKQMRLEFQQFMNRRRARRG